MTSITRAMPAQEDLLERLEYRDGILHWKYLAKTVLRVKVGDPAGSLTPDGYVRVPILGCYYPRARLVWKMQTGEDPKGQIDHINGIRDDDRIENLRDVPSWLNNRNRGLRTGENFVVITETTIGTRWVKRVEFRVTCREGEDHEGLRQSLEDAVSPIIEAFLIKRGYK